MESDPDSPPASPPTETAASSIVNLFFNEVNKQDVSGLLHVQSSLLEQLDKSNEILEGTNRISAKRYLDATREYANHTQLLVTMKTDLDSIFQRIRVLKTRLNKKYPEAYASVIEMHNQHDSLDDEDDDIVPPMKSMGNSSLVKSKTIDCSQLPPSMRETYSLAQISQTTVDQSPSSFDTITNNFDFRKRRSEVINGNSIEYRRSSTMSDLSGSSIARQQGSTNSVDCPTCRSRTNLINNSIDSLPGNYIVRDIIERQYGTTTPERPPGYAQQIQDRLQQMKKDEDGFDLEKYVKPAVAALFGVIGGLLLAKGVKKMCNDDKK
ncbi:unnamed protein product [Adineta ricciae]|uniref:KxDL domain-containing protein n=1 Tax=Adineta ricciae TaxID=249248 RepID=A0A813UDT7_ADIRI|nr:unnamed protein product [Adineta ricciae]